MRAGSRVRIAAVAAAALALNTHIALGQLREATTSVVTTPDGQPIEVTTGFVRAPELRAPDGTAPGTIDLPAVRLRRPGREHTTGLDAACRGTREGTAKGSSERSANHSP